MPSAEFSQTERNWASERRNACSACLRCWAAGRIDRMRVTSSRGWNGLNRYSSAPGFPARQQRFAMGHRGEQQAGEHLK
jgi:hypothetical protein